MDCQTYRTSPVERKISSNLLPNKTFSSEIGPDVVLDRSKSGDCETPRNSVSFTALFGESGNVCWYADELAHLLTLSLSLPGRSVLDGRESSPHT